jgi:hypothetical protein
MSRIAPVLALFAILVVVICGVSAFAYKLAQPCFARAEALGLEGRYRVLGNKCEVRPITAAWRPLPGEAP